jgi:hypothetical chaperone protein
VSAAFGIDFGTSNSAIAMATPDGRVRMVEWRPGAHTTPTVIFAPSYDAAFHVGFDAIDQYLFTGLDGRFMQSIKAFLPAATFTGTVIRNRHYSIEELVAVFLRRSREKAEAVLEMKVEGRIVFGRPARFSLDAGADALAEARLRKAAELAGFGEIELLIEPIAAALAYEATLDRDEIVLVVDLGGGTSDFTVIEVGPGRRGARDRGRDVLASGGIPVAGDAFDGQIVKARLFPRLGYGSEYLAFGAKTAVPAWMFHKLERWNHVSFLKSKQYLEFLREVAKTSNRKDDVERLIEIVDGDLSYVLFRAVERAKRSVQVDASARIADEEHALPLDEELTREQFDRATAELVESIERTAREVLAEAQLAPAGVDAVFMTGGTSLVREVRASFETLFGKDKIRERSTFTSVVDGLARAASSPS